MLLEAVHKFTPLKPKIKIAKNAANPAQIPFLCHLSLALAMVNAQNSPQIRHLRMPASGDPDYKRHSGTNGDLVFREEVTALGATVNRGNLPVNDLGNVSEGAGDEVALGFGK